MQLREARFWPLGWLATIRLRQRFPMLDKSSFSAISTLLDDRVEGYLTALGDFSEPVGPSYWEREL